MADQSQERDTAIDRLYALPLGEFTAARDELARQLRSDGDGDAGAAVQRLPKPSVAAWALNQVRRNDRGQTDELIEAGQRLREGQERLLAGGDREPLQRAAADERRLVGELAHQAEGELVAAGRPVSAAVAEKLRATLHAVASDPEAREGLAAGRLVRDHEASGLGPLTAPRAPSSRAGAGQPKPKKEPSAPAAAALPRKVSRLEARLERARGRQRELDEKTADAGRRVRETQREAARAAAELERAEAAEERTRERAKAAAKAVLELERELAATRDG
jgi:hypothetical protein